MVFAYSAFSQELPEWAQTTARTQGGGWNWYPGKASHPSKDTAFYLATSRALDYLIKECQTVPLKTKFHERFDRKVRGQWEVHVRASIKDKDCSRTRTMKDFKKLQAMSNIELLNQYMKFRNDIDAVVIDPDACSRWNLVGCLIVANTEWKLKNLGKAAAYALRGCRLGHSRSCGTYGAVLWDIGGREGEALAYLKKACEFQVDDFCEPATILEDEINKLARR